MVPSWRQPLDRDREALLDGVHAEAVTSMRAALGYPVEHKIAELTGGKSRRPNLGVSTVVSDPRRRGREVLDPTLARRTADRASPWPQASR